MIEKVDALIIIHLCVLKIPNNQQITNKTMVKIFSISIFSMHYPYSNEDTKSLKAVNSVSFLIMATLQIQDNTNHLTFLMTYQRSVNYLILVAMCKADGCNEKHHQHYCRICEVNNSDHMSSKCKQGITLYHGTRVTSISSIMSGHFKMKGGLRPTKNGRIGTGIYFANRKEAMKIAAYRGTGDQTGVAILRCQVNPNKCLTGLHPPWAGVNYNFRQWCLQGNNYRVTSIYLQQGEIEGQLNDPSVKLYLHEGVTFKGGVTANYLTVLGKDQSQDGYTSE